MNRGTNGLYYHSIMIYMYIIANDYLNLPESVSNEIATTTLTLLHSELPKLYGVLAVLSVIE